MMVRSRLLLTMCAVPFPAPISTSKAMADVDEGRIAAAKRVAAHGHGVAAGHSRRAGFAIFTDVVRELEQRWANGGWFGIRFPVEDELLVEVTPDERTRWRRDVSLTEQRRCRSGQGVYAKGRQRLIAAESRIQVQGCLHVGVRCHHSGV